MIYQFPNLDTLHLAITSGVVPPEVSLAPAVAGLDEEGHVWLQPSVALPRKAQTALRKWGVESAEANGDLQAEEITCWLQMLPVQRDKAAPPLSSQCPVLFELTDVGQLPGLVAEMLRLGNDRQSFRWLKDGRKERVLLRVIGPPYYSLLRALDANGQANAPRAYLERVPGVWVEVGHTHALIDNLKPKAGSVLLLRPPRDWQFLADGPFRDVYEILDFKLPEAKVEWRETKLGARITVPLRLVPGGAREVDELWVLRDQAYETVDRFVREADDGVIERLAFAVGEHAGQTSIVLKVRRPSKQAPPVLNLPNAVSFRPFQKLPNLFLPMGRSLQPPLRRDIVRQLLADDPAQVIWLYPHGEHSFIPQSLPDEAFLPLSGWVDYVLDHDRQAMQTWIASARFDFEAYVCKDDEERTPKPPKGKAPSARERQSMLTAGVGEEDIDPSQVTPVDKARKKPAPQEEAFAAVPEIELSQLKIQLGELEQQFVTADGPLDDPGRQALWSQMAGLNAALSNTSDASICWLNAAWDSAQPPTEWSSRWLQSETKKSEARATGADLDRLLALVDPLPADMRALAASIVVAASVDGEKPGGRSLTAAQRCVVERLPRIQAFLDKHEHRLGVRAAWLTWSCLARLSAGDVLILARARDRLLERLLNHGLSLENDLPSFLRFEGQHGSERFRTVRDRIGRMSHLAEQWIKNGYKLSASGTMRPASGPEPTLAYKDLMFAFGLARLGDVTKSRELQQRAAKLLDTSDEVHRFLLRAYTYRIDQVLAGKQHATPLPAESQEEFQAIVERHRKLAKEAEAKKAREPHAQFNPNFVPYKVNMLRQRSRILEPQERIDATDTMTASRDTLEGKLKELDQVVDPKQLGEGLAKLLSEQRKPQEGLRVLGRALKLGHRLGELSVIEYFGRLAALREQIPVVQNWHEFEERAALLERAIFLASHYDRAEHLQLFVDCFLRLLDAKSSDNAGETLARVAGQCFRSLRKLGLRHEIESLFQRIADRVVQGQDLRALRSKESVQWVDILHTLLRLATGWLYFRREDEALPILEEARQSLYEGKAAPAVQTRLACTYAETLGHAPVPLALDRFDEIFRRMELAADVFTTSSHYALNLLQVIEAVVLAVASDDFALGQNVRRWMDEDEYLVRRRIHGDLRALVAQAGF